MQAMTTDTTTGWWQPFYRDADVLNLDGLMSHFTEGAIARLGDSEQLEGKAAIRKRFGEFWSMIRGMKHDFFNIIEAGDFVALESRIDYTRLDGHIVNVPCATVLRKVGASSIGEIRIYVDLGPVFAPI